LIIGRIYKDKVTLTKRKLNKEEKAAELTKYRNLVIATLDYYIDNQIAFVPSLEFNSIEYYKSLKLQTEENFQKGRLSKLKQWFRDMTEIMLETGDLKFNKYLQDKTHSNIDIFESYFKRIEKIIEQGKIRTDNQYYDMKMKVDQLCQSEIVDNEKIKNLNKLLLDYEQNKTEKK
jgi:hypothetical protein